MTYVRAAWMGMAAGALVIGSIRGRKWALALVISGMVLVVGISFFSPSIESKLMATFDPDYPANRHRLFLWARSIEMFEDYPLLGIGWGNYQTVCPEYIDKVNPKFPYKFRSHNLFLNHLAETGLVGFTALLFLLFRIISYLIKGIKKYKILFQNIRNKKVYLCIDG